MQKKFILKNNFLMTTLFFESHATSIDNEKGIASGWLNPALSDKGKQQAEELGSRYENEDISVIYVSDSKRSFETAQIAFGHRKIPIVRDSRLREWNYGKFNGIAAEEIEKLKISYFEIPFPEGESFHDVLKRFNSFKKECLEGTNDTVLIIGHRATYYALEFDCNNTPIETLLTTKWKWQPGWKYFLQKKSNTTKLLEIALKNRFIYPCKKIEFVEEAFMQTKRDEIFNVLFSKFALNRNDPCFCRSGKKYKKCCMTDDNVQTALDGNVTRVENITIKYDALSPDDDPYGFHEISEEDLQKLNELFHLQNHHPEQIDSENCGYFLQLAFFRLKYQRNPKILNFLAMGYQILGDKKKVRELILETYEKFPNYLFGLTGMANLLLHEGKTEQAIELFNGAATLKQLYPHRHVFHISEVRFFETFMLDYSLFVGDIKQARIRFKILNSLDD